MRRGVSGKYLTGYIELIRPFIPAELPPDPPIEISDARQRLLERAMLSLCRLDTIGLPHYAFIRREAVLSERISGNQSSLVDLLLFELKGASDAPFRNVAEISDYVAALEHGLTGLRSGFPLSNGLIREMHRVLFSRAWRSITPGEFRDLQNWAGGTRPSNAHYVPPPPTQVENCMAALERFMQDSTFSMLIKAGLVHVQFESIRPFFRGNGRIGRMLVPLLTHPLLNLSLSLRDRQPHYHHMLDLVREEGDWESWLDFFLEAAGDAASNTISIAQQLAALLRDDARRVHAVGRGAPSTLRVYRGMCERPITSLKKLCGSTGLPFPTAANSIDRLTALGIVTELSGGRRNRVFAYDRYLAIIGC